MALSATSAPRAVLLQRAEGLRRRIAGGECPYPDEVGAANDAFISRLRETRGADAASVAAALERGAWIPDTVKLTGVATALATAALCLAGAPGPLTVASATVGGAAARALFRLSRNLGLKVAANRKTADRVRAWDAWGSDAAPSVTKPAAPLTSEGLRAATVGFDHEVAGFPYADVASRGHARLVACLEKRTIEDARAELAAPRAPGRRVPEIIVTAAHAFSVAACGAGAGLLAAGHPLLAAGAFGAFAAREAVRLAEIRRGQTASTSAQALDYWERAATPAGKGNP